MKDKKPRDNLSLDAMDAVNAGMSYGQYKAMHPRTKDANEHRLAKNPQKAATTLEVICKHCGEKFITTNSKMVYCGANCQHEESLQQHNERKRQRLEEAKRRASGGSE